MKKIKYWLLLFASLSWLIYDYFWLSVNRTGSAVLQLQDSDVLYGLGKKAATGGGVFTILFLIAVSMLIYSVFKLFMKGDEK